MYRAENGKILDDSVILSRSRQDSMLSKGWELRRVDLHETAQEAYDRISAANPFRIVRIYSATTAIKGYHDKYAMIKWNKKAVSTEIPIIEIS